ncbi:MAG: VOC family protein [Planctomycetota bacterium]
MPEPRITGYHHVALHVADIDKSLAFWKETFGMTEKLRWTIGDGRAAVMLDIGDGNYLEFFQAGPGHTFGSRDGGNADHALAHIALRCVGIDALIEKVRGLGMTITMEPKTVDIDNVCPATASPTPVRIAFFIGPDGEIVELFENELT